MAFSSSHLQLGSKMRCTCVRCRYQNTKKLRRAQPLSAQFHLRFSNVSTRIDFIFTKAHLIATENALRFKQFYGFHGASIASNMVDSVYTSMSAAWQMDGIVHW